MSDPRAFDGLIEHLERYAGPFAGAEPATAGGGNRGFDLAFYTEDGLTTVVSNGVRFQDLAGDLPVELVCSVAEEQADGARHLLDVAGRLLVDAGRAIGWGEVMDNGQPLLTGTAIEGLLAGPHPIFPDGFDLFPDADAPALRLVTLVPAVRGELDLAVSRSVGEVYDAWSERRTDVTDLERPA